MFTMFTVVLSAWVRLMGMLELNLVSEEMVSHLSKKEAWHPEFKIPQRSPLKVPHFKASKTRKFHSLAGSSKGGAREACTAESVYVRAGCPVTVSGWRFPTTVPAFPLRLSAVFSIRDRKSVV